MLDQRRKALREHLPRRDTLWTVYVLREKGEEREAAEILETAHIGRLVLYPSRATTAFFAALNDPVDGRPWCSMSSAHVRALEHGRMSIYGKDDSGHPQVWCCIVSHLSEESHGPFKTGW